MISVTYKVQCVELLGHISADDPAQLPLLGLLIQVLDDLSMVVHRKSWDNDILLSNCDVFVEGFHMIFSTLYRFDYTWYEVRLD